MTLFRLFCGLQKRDGSNIGERAIKAFLYAVISKEFPGFTALDARGYWLGNPEPSLVLEVLAPATDDVRIDALAAKYCEAFDQEAVLVCALPLAYAHLAGSKEVHNVA